MLLIIWCGRSKNDEIIHVVVEKKIFPFLFLRSIMPAYISDSPDFNSCILQHLNRVAPQPTPINTTEHNNFPGFSFLINIPHPISFNLHTQYWFESHNHAPYVFFFKTTFSRGDAGVLRWENVFCIPSVSSYVFQESDS